MALAMAFGSHAKTPVGQRVTPREQDVGNQSVTWLPRLHLSKIRYTTAGCRACGRRCSMVAGHLPVLPNEAGMGQER